MHKGYVWCYHELSKMFFLKKYIIMLNESTDKFSKPSANICPMFLQSNHAYPLKYHAKDMFTCIYKYVYLHS